MIYTVMIMILMTCCNDYDYTDMMFPKETYLIYGFMDDYGPELIFIYLFRSIYLFIYGIYLFHLCIYSALSPWYVLS